MSEVASSEWYEKQHVIEGNRFRFSLLMEARAGKYFQNSQPIAWAKLTTVKTQGSSIDDLEKS